MASESEKKPIKGILKHSASLDKTQARREVEWDEMNILVTHHPPDKDYGHMKIDEPPTPYSKLSDAEDEGEEQDSERRGSSCNISPLDASSLASRLEESQKHAHHKTAVVVEPESSEEDENETEEERAKRKAFEAKRKLHYNEFAAVRLAKKLMSEDNDDEDDDKVDKAENCETKKKHCMCA